MEGQEGYRAAPSVSSYHDYASPRGAAGAVELGRGGAHYVPPPAAGGGHPGRQHDERVRVAGLHAELRRLIDDERGLLAHVDGPAEKRDLKEQFFHQRMNLVAQLPESERGPYLAAGGMAQAGQIRRMGTVRDNLDGEADVEYSPLFMYAVFAVNVAVFVWSIQKNGWEFAPTDVNPLYGPTPEVLVDMGAKVGSKIRDDGEWWRWFTPVFLHAGVIHLLMNMVVLLRLGVSMEQAFGHTRVAVIYLVSGVAGNLASAIFLPEEIGVGASGALFGLIGALFGDFLHNYRTMRSGRCCYFMNLVLSSAVGLAIGLFPLLDNFAHVGGWVAGILTGAVFLAGSVKDHRGKAVTYCYTYPVAIVSLFLLVVIFLAGFTTFYDNVDPNGWCSWCESLSCMETPWWDCDDALGRAADADGGGA